MRFTLLPLVSHRREAAWHGLQQPKSWVILVNTRGSLTRRTCRWWRHRQVWSDWLGRCQNYLNIMFSHLCDHVKFKRTLSTKKNGHIHDCFGCGLEPRDSCAIKSTFTLSTTFLLSGPRQQRAEGEIKNQKQGDKQRRWRIKALDN